MKKIILWLLTIVASISIFIVAAYVLMVFPEYLQKDLTKLTGVLTLCSFLFGGVYVPYLIQKSGKFPYKLLLQILCVATFSTYFLMYFSYMFLGFQAHHPYISGVGFDICTINLTILVIISYLLVKVRSVK